MSHRYLSKSLGLLLLLGVAASAQEQKVGLRERFLRFGTNFRKLGGPSACEKTTVNFDKSADGTDLSPPLCVENEWKSLGLTLFAEGGEGSLPCLFDTADPRPNEDCGDADLGSPNEACTPPGPGEGEPGAPGGPGENCEERGNVLIIQEPGSDCPDDNQDGGTLTLDWPCEGGAYVEEIGLLDIDYATTVFVVYEKDDGTMAEREIVVPVLGDNSYQTLPIDQANGTYHVYIDDCE